MRTSTLHSSIPTPARLLLLVSVLSAWATASASDHDHLHASDLSNFPVATELQSESGAPLDTSYLAKPNIAFIVDDSGSMDEQNMPNGDGSNKGSRCYGWYGYNTLAYNPTVTYKPPYKPDGALYSDGVPRYPDQVFNDALEDGYLPAWGNTFSSNSRKNNRVSLEVPWYRSHPSIPLPYGGDNSDYMNFYYTYPERTSDESKTDCLHEDRYEAVVSSSAIQAPEGVDAKINYANWYSYYRRRAYLMKAAAGDAFKDVDTDRFRVGLFFINSQDSGADGTSAPNSDLKIDDFKGDHRNQWFAKLYAGRGSGSTPLRGALSRAGRMYAGRDDWDPVQYSCQQNYTILSTDGYWNTGGEDDRNDGDGLYGAYDISGEEVGDRDSGPNIDPPYRDGTSRDNGGRVSRGEGQANTLADIAYYYYTTDLRDTSLNNCSNADDGDISSLCENNVPANGKDDRVHQRMVTHTIGLGVSGEIFYESNYESAKDNSKDQYFDIVNGNVRWPRVDISSVTDEKKIDDLWHAAVNGRGRYYSAKDVKTLREGIQSILAEIKATKGSASAAATSSMQPVREDDAAYVAQYRTVKWDGDVLQHVVDLATGELVRDETKHWSAKKKLDQQSTRSIKFFKANAETNNLADFFYDNLDAGLKPYFDNLCQVEKGASQCVSTTDKLTDDQIALANNGRNLVNYLRGTTTYEDEDSNPTAENRIYRGREHLLGDVVHSSPVYVKDPRFLLGVNDPTYREFQTAQMNREATVYVGANDGMLHAINAATGQERWAYVPRMVMPHMWRLADRNYSAQHRYFVDGAPAVMDICTQQSAENPQLCAGASHWRTILVAGLNKGGCGYFALDVTNPNVPKGLWEFTHQNLGYSYGNPLIVKNKQGKWVVIFTSGYNNSSQSRSEGECAGQNGDGNGYVYVLDAETGELMDDDDYPIATKDGNNAVGTAADPSNLGKLNAWIESPASFVADRLYAGDMKGNVWRIDFDGNYGEKKATLLATLKDAGDRVQPITTRPELALFDGTYPVVMVGTGKLIGSSDLQYMAKQSFYAIKDELTSTGIDDVRDGSLVQKTLTQVEASADGQLKGAVIRKLSGNTVNWNEDAGWYMDFDPGNASPGERVNVDMRRQAGVLVITTNVPEKDACSAGGSSVSYFIDVKTAGPVAGAAEGMIGMEIPKNALAAGVEIVRLPTGEDVAIVTLTNGESITLKLPKGSGTSSLGKRRVAWRELVH